MARLPRRGLGRLGLRGDAQAATPLRQAYPAVAIDAMTWVRHALSLLEDGQVRLRHTSIDNAPDGREVHWNSGWAWAIAGAGRAYQWLHGGPIEHAVEKATLWLNPFAFMIAIVALSSWTARHAGAAAGVFIAAAMALSERIEEGFLPSYVDHHGLLTVCVLGVVLGSVAMGGGLWRERPADSSTLLPVRPSQVPRGRAALGVERRTGPVDQRGVGRASDRPRGFRRASVIAFDFATPRRSARRSVRCAAWRLWGRVGALASLAFLPARVFSGDTGLAPGGQPSALRAGVVRRR
jgi:drug/metabolite transporter superfamily protein YnfA